MVHVRDLMSTDVVTVSPELTLRDAIEFLTARHIGGAPWWRAACGATGDVAIVP